MYVWAQSSGADIAYLMDIAELWEIEMYLDGLAKRNEEEWRQVRFNSYVTAQVNSVKKLSPSDILQLPSDPKTEKLDLKKLKKSAKNILA